MDEREKKTIEKMEKKLENTTKRIKKTRKNIRLAEMENNLFKEIHELLENFESIHDTSEKKSEPKPHDKSVTKNLTVYSFTPDLIPWLNVVNDQLMFNLFNEESLRLANFVDKESVLCGIREANIRNHIWYNKIDVISELVSINDCSDLILYILYLMSVHPDKDFVLHCYVALLNLPGKVYIEDIFPIFINWGVNVTDIYKLNDEKLFKKIGRNKGNIDKARDSETFPQFNADRIGMILISYVIQNNICYSDMCETFLKLIVRLVLDEKFVSKGLGITYKDLLDDYCFNVCKRGILEPRQVVNILCDKERDVLLQVQLCLILAKNQIHLHEAVTLKTISHLLESEDLPEGPLIKIEHVKVILEKLKEKEVPLLEFFCILVLIADILPEITATSDECTEINFILTRLDNKIGRIEDSVDLIRVKRELGKVRCLLAKIVKD